MNLFKSKIPLPKIDFVFQWLFGNPANAEIFKSFLEAILGTAIAAFEMVSYEDARLLRRHQDDKMGILDVLVTLVDGTQLNIEMQLYFHKFLLERITFYNAKLVAGQLQKGEDYTELRKVVSILISAENAIPSSPHYHHTFRLYDEAHNVLLTDLVEIHVLELDKLPVQPEESMKYNWLKFFKSDSEEELKMAASSDEFIKKAYEELEKLGQDEHSMREYELRLMAIRDEQARIQTAEERGEQRGEQLLKQVFKMLRDNKSAEEIQSKMEIDAKKLARYKADFDELFH